MASRLRSLEFCPGSGDLKRVPVRLVAMFSLNCLVFRPLRGAIWKRSNLGALNSGVVLLLYWAPRRRAPRRRGTSPTVAKSKTGAAPLGRKRFIGTKRNVRSAIVANVPHTVAEHTYHGSRNPGSEDLKRVDLKRVTVL